MEQARRNLRVVSICVLALAVFTLVRLGVSFFLSGFDAAAGIDQLVLMIAKCIVIAITFVTLIPQVYIGVRGLQNANYPTKAKAPIVWAVILTVYSATGLITPIVSFFTQGFVFDNISTVGTLCCSIALYCAYISCAKTVADGAN